MRPTNNKVLVGFWLTSFVAVLITCLRHTVLNRVSYSYRKKKRCYRPQSRPFCLDRQKSTHDLSRLPNKYMYRPRNRSYWTFYSNRFWRSVSRTCAGGRYTEPEGTSYLREPRPSFVWLVICCVSGKTGSECSVNEMKIIWDNNFMSIRVCLKSL